MAYALWGDEWFNDPRLCDAGPAGRDFFHRALMFCNLRRTDGRLRDEDLAAIAPGQRYPNKVARRLADLGLFQRIPGGYLIPPELYRCFNRFAKDLPAARRGLRPPPPLRGSTQPPGRLPADSPSSRFHARTDSTATYATKSPETPTAPAPSSPGMKGEEQLQDARAREAERRAQSAELRKQIDSSIAQHERDRLARASGRRGEPVRLEGLIARELDDAQGRQA